MRGRIFLMGRQAKIEIWKDSWMLENNIDAGGYCEICRKRFNKVRELVIHFVSMHNG